MKKILTTTLLIMSLVFIGVGCGSSKSDETFVATAMMYDIAIGHMEFPANWKSEKKDYSGNLIQVPFTIMGNHILAYTDGTPEHRITVQFISKDQIADHNNDWKKALIELYSINNSEQVKILSADNSNKNFGYEFEGDQFGNHVYIKTVRSENYMAVMITKNKNLVTEKIMSSVAITK